MPTSSKRAPRATVLTAGVAAVVAVAALVVIVVLRQSRESTPASSGAPAAAPAQNGEKCGPDPCRQMAAVSVGGLPVKLLADASGGSGRVKVGGQPVLDFELAITGMGAKLTDHSLRCVDGSPAACLVRGNTSGGAYGELLIGEGGTWSHYGKPYFADAGTLSLSDVTGDGSPDVILVRHECPDETPGTPKCQESPVLAEVYELNGDLLGCTTTVTSPSNLRGWPEVEVSRTQLRPCPDGS